MLDTGSEVTLVPGVLVEELPKRTIVSGINAANGTLLEVLGEVDHPALLHGKEILIRAVAADHVGELLLSIDWLETKGAVGDLRWGELHMGVQIHKLKPETNGG